MIYQVARPVGGSKSAFQPPPHQPGPSTEGESNLEIFPPRKSFVYEATQRVSRPKWTWWMSTPPYEVAKLNFEPGPPRMGRNTSVFVMLLYIFLYAPFVLKSRRMHPCDRSDARARDEIANRNQPRHRTTAGRQDLRGMLFPMFSQ